MRTLIFNGNNEGDGQKHELGNLNKIGEQFKMYNAAMLDFLIFSKTK